MSRRPIARSADLSRLLAEGYDVAVRAGHLVVSRIPYVTAGRTVAYGTLITRLDLQDDRTKAPDDHTIFFVGQYPCDKDGRPIEAIRNSSGSVKIAEELVADHRFSAKPQPKGNYDNYYDKIVNYAAILSGPARALDTSVRSNPGSFVPAAEDDDSIFKYLDTASPRAEITAATAKLEMRKVVLIGLGGSGSYILDLIAKTPVEQIHTYDGDILHQHNAFRAPGATSGDELAAEPKKSPTSATSIRRCVVGSSRTPSMSTPPTSTSCATPTSFSSASTTDLPKPSSSKSCRNLAAASLM